MVILRPPNGLALHLLHQADDVALRVGKHGQGYHSWDLCRGITVFPPRLSALLR